MEFMDLLQYAKKNECSDIHITVGTAVAIRRFGELSILKDYVPSAEESEKMIRSLLNERQQQIVDGGRDLDFACMIDEDTRLRVNVYRQRNNLAISIRVLNEKIPSFEELGLPRAVQEMCELPRGLVLVTGPTGSGKSTTLASMIDYINSKYARHIMTIEDPIEYIYNHGKSMIHQREVGRDVDSFATALRSSLREDPDIILVGEMRDYETISAAITAAETGHLVLSTLHTTSAAQTIDRILDSCPNEGQNQLRIQLAGVLKAVFSQALLSRNDNMGRIVATEVMVANDAITNLIRENKAFQINSVIQSNQQSGMHTLNYDLANMVHFNKVEKEEALKYSPNPKEFMSMV